MFTVEIAEQYTSTSAVNDPNRCAESEAHATALREVLLGPPLPASGGGGGPGAPAQQAPAPDAVQRSALTQIAAGAGNRAAVAAVRRMSTEAVGTEPTTT